jgi:MFS family permease
MKASSSFQFNSPILKIKDFRYLLFTYFLIIIALQVQAVIVGWQIYQINKDPLLLGLIGLTEAIPAITCSFFSGHIVDISKPATIFRISILVILLNTLMIFSTVSPGIQWPAHLQLAVLFFGIFISGAARSFTSPAQFSLIPQVVPRSLLSAAAAFGSSGYTFAAIIGPAIGGLAYGFVGAVWAFALPCVFALIAFLFSNFLSKEAKQLQSHDSKREPMWQSIRSGMSFIYKEKVLVSTMALDMFSVLFGGAVAVLPIFADQVFHVGSTGLGLLRSAPAVGSVLISIYLALRPMKVISGARLLFVIGGFGVMMVLFATTHNFYWALIFLAISGVFDGVNMVIRGTIKQLLTPDHMRGRVSSLSTIFTTSSNEIGAFESGVAAKLIGLGPSVIFGGVMTLLIVAFVTVISPELRRTKIES